MSSDPWGRVDETGTVYVRTADGGERVVGSWQAGSPEEALAYFERKYDGLVVEIGLLERRVKTTDLSAKDATTAIDHLRQQVDEAHAVGDLDALGKRLDKLVETVEARREERKAQKAKQSDEARHSKEALVAEAEELAQSEQWRAAGERLRALVDTWKGLPRLDRKSDDELWHRFSHARSAFSKRRKAHFASLDAQREDARKAKEKLVAEAEALSGSTDWGPTAARYRELMSDWKAAGRAQREHEDDLWNRFRGAQDVFFAASGPKEWQRVEAHKVDSDVKTAGSTVTVDQPERRPVVPAQVSNITSDDNDIAFDVDQIGQPVLVKASYFPNWRAKGAKGPYRVTPNLMVVIPTDEHVTLTAELHPVLLSLYLKRDISDDNSKGCGSWTTPHRRRSAPVRRLPVGLSS